MRSNSEDEPRGGWTSAVSQGGTLIGGPVVAAGSLQTDILAEGTDKAVWDISTVADWSSLGGAVLHGCAVGDVGWQDSASQESQQPRC